MSNTKPLVLACVPTVGGKVVDIDNFSDGFHLCGTDVARKGLRVRYATTQNRGAVGYLSASDPLTGFSRPEYDVDLKQYWAKCDAERDAAEARAAEEKKVRRRAAAADSYFRELVLAFVAQGSADPVEKAFELFDKLEELRADPAASPQAQPATK